MEILSLPENEPFITGIEESIDICSNQIMKLADASIFHCRSGKAHIEIDLQAYEVTENTQLLLLPGSIFNCTCASHDFTVSYIVFSDTLFREITSRLDPSFFHFLKEHPCIVIPEERVKPFIGLSLVMKDLYEDRDNSFRIQINPEKPDVPLNKNDAFQKVQKRRVQENGERGPIQHDQSPPFFFHLNPL